MIQQDCTRLLLHDIKYYCKFTDDQLSQIEQRLNWAYVIGNESKPGNKGKGVIQLDNSGKYIATFQSIREAGEQIGTQYQNIQKVITGKRHSAGGYLWMLESDYKKLHR